MVLLVMKFLLTRCIWVGFLERRKGERKRGGGGGRRQLHLEILGVKSKILRVARVYMIQLGYKYC